MPLWEGNTFHQTAGVAFSCLHVLVQESLRVLFMQSDGGLTPMNNFIGSKAILSGPAGGVVSMMKVGEGNIYMGGESWCTIKDL